MDLFDEPIICRDSAELRAAIRRVHELAGQLEHAARFESSETMCAIGDEMQSAVGMVAFHAGYTEDQSRYADDGTV